MGDPIVPVFIQAEGTEGKIGADRVYGAVLH